MKHDNDSFAQMGQIAAKGWNFNAYMPIATTLLAAG
jgi:hypothetical protein